MEKIRIIIADDHQLFRNGLKILLNAFPEFEVTGEASNGEEFLKLLKNTPADVALMDINMPEMDGIEATRILKKQFPEILIIAQTACAFPEEQESAMQAGCDDFIVKPINKEKMIGKLQRENFQKAVKEGVKIAYGTDAGSLKGHRHRPADLRRAVRGPPPGRHPPRPQAPEHHAVQ